MRRSLSPQLRPQRPGFHRHLELPPTTALSRQSPAAQNKTPRISCLGGGASEGEDEDLGGLEGQPGEVTSRRRARAILPNAGCRWQAPLCFGPQTSLPHHSAAGRAPPTKGAPGLGRGACSLPSAHKRPVLPEPAVGLDRPQLRLGVGAEGAPGRLAAGLHDRAGAGARGADVHGGPHAAHQRVQPPLQRRARRRRVPARLLHLRGAHRQAEDGVQAVETLLHVGAAGGPVVQPQGLL